MHCAGIALALVARWAAPQAERAETLEPTPSALRKFRRFIRTPWSLVTGPAVLQLCAPKVGFVAVVIVDGWMRGMTLETPPHAERLGLIHFLHLVDPPVAFDTSDTARHVSAVVEVGVVGKGVDSHPVDR